MKQKLDLYDTISIWTLVISSVLCVALVWRSAVNLKAGDDELIIIVSDISAVFSIGGLFIAVLQIFKVSNNTKTYKEAYDRTIDSINNNASLSLLARSLEQLSLIKHLFENQLEKDSRSYFNNLVLDLTFLKSNKNIDDTDMKQINNYIEYCITMDTVVYKDKTGVDKNVDYSLKYETLSQMQSLLISIQQKLSTPKGN